VTDIVDNIISST